jgi:hypothetical protein
MSNETIQAIQLGSSVLGVILIIFALKKWENYRNKRDFINKKKVQLQLHTIDELLAIAEEEKSLLLRNIEKGLPFLERARAQVKTLEEDTAHISAGLVPPVFNLDDSESLKNSIVQRRNDQYACIKNRNATQAFSNWS